MEELPNKWKLVCAVHAEGVQYGLGCAVRVDCVQYSLSVWSTG